MHLVLPYVSDSTMSCLVVSYLSSSTLIRSYQLGPILLPFSFLLISTENHPIWSVDFLLSVASSLIYSYLIPIRSCLFPSIPTYSNLIPVYLFQFIPICSYLYLFLSILFYSSLFLLFLSFSSWSNLSIPIFSTCSIPFRSVPFHPNPFPSVPRHSTPFCSMLA